MFPFQSWTIWESRLRSITFSSNWGIIRSLAGKPSPSRGQDRVPPASRYARSAISPTSSGSPCRCQFRRVDLRPTPGTKGILSVVPNRSDCTNRLRPSMVPMAVLYFDLPAVAIEDVWRETPCSYHRTDPCPCNMQSAILVTVSTGHPDACT